MSRGRSISYAPWSSRPARSEARARSAPRPDWTLCRNLKVVPVLDNAVLQRWTEIGRVRPDDYLVNEQLDICVQARDVAEIDAVFRKARARLLDRISCGLACGALALAWPIPQFAMALLATAIATALLSARLTHRRPAYRLYTTGEHCVTTRPNAHDRVPAASPASPACCSHSFS